MTVLISSGCTESPQAPLVPQTPQTAQPSEVVSAPTVSSAAPLRVGIRMRNHHDVRLYRGQQTGAYASTGVEVHFFTKGAEEDAPLSNVSKDRDAFRTLRGTRSSNVQVGKTTQDDLDAALAARELDCISTGAVGFLHGISKGRLRKAVLTLGRSSKDSPSTDLLIRTGFRPDNPGDWSGATVVVTQANPIDRILIDELRRQVGVAAGALNHKAVSEFREVADDLRSGKIDLAMIPRKRAWRATMLIDSLISTGVFRRGDAEIAAVGGLDLNQQLLVCSNEIVADSAERLVPFLEAYRSLVKVRDDPEELSGPTGADAEADGHHAPRAAARKRAAEKVNHAAEPVDTARLEALQQLMVRQERLKTAQPIAPWVINPLLGSTAPRDEDHQP